MSSAIASPRREGLTVIELLIIIVIVCILAVIVWPRLRSRGERPEAARVVRVVGPDSAVLAADSAEVVVRVEGRDGQPVRGVRVDFDVASGVGSVDPAGAQSDSAGLVTVIWRFGADSGVNRLTARVRGKPEAKVEMATRAGLSLAPSAR
jgi:hypothetical protein